VCDEMTMAGNAWWWKGLKQTLIGFYHDTNTETNENRTKKKKTL